MDCVVTLALEMPWRAGFIAVAAGVWKGAGCAGVGPALADRIARAFVAACKDEAPRRIAAVVRFLVFLGLPSTNVLEPLDTASQLAEWARACAASPGHRLSGVVMEAILEALMVCGDAVNAARPGTPRECLDAAESVASFWAPTAMGKPAAGCASSPFLPSLADLSWSSSLHRACGAAKACASGGWRSLSAHRPDLDPRAAQAMAGGAPSQAWPPATITADELLVGLMPEPEVSAAARPLSHAGCGTNLGDAALLALATSTAARVGRGDLPLRCCFQSLASPLLVPGSAVATPAALAAVGIRAVDGAGAAGTGGKESTTAASSAPILASAADGAASTETVSLCDVPSALLVQRAVLDCACTHYPLHEDAAIEISRLAGSCAVGGLAVDALVGCLLQQPRSPLPSGYLMLLLKQLERADMRGLGAVAAAEGGQAGASGDTSLSGAAAAAAPPTAAASGQSDDGGHGDEDDEDDEGAAGEARLLFFCASPPGALRVSDGIATVARVLFKRSAELHPASASRFCEWCAWHAAASGWRWLWDEWAVQAARRPSLAPLLSHALQRTLALERADFADVLGMSMAAETAASLRECGLLPVVAQPGPLGQYGAASLANFPPPATELDSGLVGPSRPPPRGQEALLASLRESLSSGHPAIPPAAAFAAVLPCVHGLVLPGALAEILINTPADCAATLLQAMAAACVFHGRARLTDCHVLVAAYRPCLLALAASASSEGAAAPGAGTGPGAASQALATAVVSCWESCGQMCELVLCRLVAGGLVQAEHAVAAVLRPESLHQLWRGPAAMAVVLVCLSELREARDAVMRFVHLVPGVGDAQSPEATNEAAATGDSRPSSSSSKGQHEGDSSEPASSPAKSGSSSSSSSSSSTGGTGGTPAPAGLEPPPLVGRAKPLEHRRAALESAQARWASVLRRLGSLLGAVVADDKAEKLHLLSLVRTVLSLAGDGTFGRHARPWSRWFAHDSAASLTEANPSTAAMVAAMLDSLECMGWADMAPRLDRDAFAPMPV